MLSQVLTSISSYSIYICMARKKVKLEWIVNDSARRATLKKRKKGLMKKVSELSTLCDVKACLIVYGPNEPQAAAEVWPSVPDAMRVLARLKKMPEMEQSKKMMNQEGFMRQRIVKLQEQLRKQDRENRELETTLLMYRGLAGRSLHTAVHVTIEDMTSLAWLIEMKVNKVQERIEHSKAEIASKMVEGVMKEEEKKVVEGPSNIKEKTPLEVAMEELQRQEWFAEIIVNPHDLMIGGNEVVQPYMDHNNPWLDAYFP